MQVHRVAVGNRSPNEPGRELEEQWLAELEAVDVPLGKTTTLDIHMPRNSAGTATRNPAMGPAMPMSNSMRLLGIGSRMRMKAPSVPVSGRTGPAEKTASEASTS